MTYWKVIPSVAIIFMANEYLKKGVIKSYLMNAEDRVHKYYNFELKRYKKYKQKRKYKGKYYDV